MNKLSLEILGSQSPFCLKNEACPSYYITDGESKILLDCGSGSHRFFDMDNLNDLNIFISHLHRDHYNDIFNYQYTSFVYHNMGKLKDKINIFLPEINRSISKDIIGEKNSYSNYFEINEGEKYNIGKFKVEFRRIAHSPQVKAFATKLTYGDKKIVYTGDVSYSSKQKLVEFANDADLLICEASLLKEHNFPEICSHLTAYQAGEIAKCANVKNLLLTHFWPLEDRDKYLKEAKEKFDNVILAKEGLIIDLNITQENQLDF